MTPASIHTSSNPGTAHPPIDRAKVPSMDEWKAMMHRKRGLVGQLAARGYKIERIEQ